MIGEHNAGSSLILFLNFSMSSSALSANCLFNEQYLRFRDIYSSFSILSIESEIASLGFFPSTTAIDSILESIAIMFLSSCIMFCLFMDEEEDIVSLYEEGVAMMPIYCFHVMMDGECDVHSVQTIVEIFRNSTMKYLNNHMISRIRKSGFPMCVTHAVYTHYGPC